MSATTDPIPSGMRCCRTCGEAKCYPASFPPRTRVCKTCNAAKAAAWRNDAYAQHRAEQRCARVDHLAKRAAAVARRRAERARLHEIRGPQQRSTSANPTHTPFDVTLRQLEAHWGQPFATWSHAQHREHTALLCRLAGIPELKARAGSTA